MTLLPVQFLILAFVLFALARTAAQFRAGHVRLAGLLGWSAFWLAVGVVGVLPQTTTLIARAVGVGRGADLVIYASIGALFYLVFRLFVKLEENEREITRLVRALAVGGMEKELKDLKEL